MVRCANGGPGDTAAVNGAGDMPLRLAIVATHPIQYFSPWFQRLAARGDLSLRVFYLWDFGVESRHDEGFAQPIVWDIPMLAGYDHEFVPNRARKPGTHRFSGLWNPAIVERIRAFRPDAVVVFGYNYATLLRLLLSPALRTVPFLFRGDSHRLVRREGWREHARRSIISRIFKRFCAFLHVGSANREYFIHHGIPDDKLFLSPHAVDNDRFIAEGDAAAQQARDFRRSLGIAPQQQVILFAGKFEPKKRPLDLLRAFAGATVRGAALLFVGAGELEPVLRDEASGRADVFFAPFQNQTMMPTVYAAADVFVLPSYGGAETWGLAVNEAMCLGRPAIVSDHVGCARDLVIPERTGLVFHAGDVDGLRKCLERALADPVRLREWGGNGRELIRGFSYDHATRGLMSALAACVPRRT